MFLGTIHIILEASAGHVTVTVDQLADGKSSFLTETMPTLCENCICDDTAYNSMITMITLIHTG